MTELLRGDTAIFEDHDACPYIIGPTQTVFIPKSRQDLALNSLRSHQGALNAMYEMSSWVQQQTNSDDTRLSHFNSFFAEKHRICKPLSGKISLTCIVDTLIHGMKLFQSSKVWLKCFAAIKLQIKLKRRVRIFNAERTKERSRLLADMLQYWQDAEKKKTIVARKAMEEMAVLSPDKYRQRAGGLSALFTPDTVKLMVLWELYWLLRAQLSYNRAIYMNEKSRLVAQRRKAMGLMKVHRPGAQKDLVDTNAALFILFLQEPTLKFNPRSIPFNALIHLAKVSTNPDCGAVVPSCRIFSAFVALPICNTVAWFQKRRTAAYPLVPKVPPGYMGANTVRQTAAMDEEGSDDECGLSHSLSSSSSLDERRKSGLVHLLSKSRSKTMTFSSGRSPSLGMVPQFSTRHQSPTYDEGNGMARAETPTYRRPGQRLVSRGQKVHANPHPNCKEHRGLLEREASICAAPPVQSVSVRPFSVSSSQKRNIL